MFSKISGGVNCSVCPSVVEGLAGVLQQWSTDIAVMQHCNSYALTQQSFVEMKCLF